MPLTFQRQLQKQRYLIFSQHPKKCWLCCNKKGRKWFSFRSKKVTGQTKRSLLGGSNNLGEEESLLEWKDWLSGLNKAGQVSCCWAPSLPPPCGWDTYAKANGSGKFLLRFACCLLRAPTGQSAPASSTELQSWERPLLCPMVRSWQQATWGLDTCSWGLSMIPSLHCLLEKFLLENNGCLEVAYFNVKEGNKREKGVKGKTERGTITGCEGLRSHGQPWVQILTLPFTNMELVDKLLTSPSLSFLLYQMEIIMLISWGHCKWDKISKILGPLAHSAVRTQKR